MESGFPDLAPEAPPRPQGNGLGVAGFVISLAGIVTCGLLSPLAAIFSLIGLGRQPKGLAIAGTVLSVVGMLELVGGVFFVRPIFTTVVDGLGVKTSIDAYKEEHGDFPDEAEALRILAGARDGWDTPLRYSRTTDGYRLESAGPDRRFGTGDDIDLRDVLKRR